MVRIAAVALVLARCAGPELREEPPPAPAASFAEELRKAAEVTAQKPALVVRYNPVQCNCPGFEVQVGPRWVRVAIDGTKDATSPAARLLARAKADHGEDKVVQYTVAGELDPSPERCAQGAYYLTLSLVSVE